MGGAYEVLVAMAVVISMVPFVFLFGSMVRLQDADCFPNEAVSSAALPQGFAGKLTNLPRWLSILLGAIGACSATFAIGLSLIPPLEEPHKLLYVSKLIGASGVVTGIGALLFRHGRRRT